MNNHSTRADITPHSLWQKALDKVPNGLLVYEIVKQGGAATRLLIQLANQQAERLFGLSKEEMTGRFAHDLFPDAGNFPLWSDIERAIRTGQPTRREVFSSISRSGIAAWFDVGIEPLDDNRCAVVSFHDITEWKQTQQSLLSDSILFQALSSTVPEMGVVAIDFFRKIALANGQLPGLFISNMADDLVGRRFLDAIETKYGIDWQRYISTAFDGEQHYFTDHWNNLRCEIYVGPVRNPSGQVVMVLAVFKNVSEQYAQQQALQQANVSLHRSNESLERFAYVASHDLQEPLRKIRAFGDMLNVRYAPSLDEGGRDMIARMQSAAIRMDELIRSLLSFSRINTPLLTFYPVNLGDLLRGVQGDLELVIGEKGAKVEVLSPMPVVAGDETQLRQLFQNLMTNALKFVAPGVAPRVTITARILPKEELPYKPDPNLAYQLQYAEISVADNGIGIDQDNFQKIFGLFTRLHGRSTYAGTGIGLATTKRVAENHGGTITVSSEVGKGTVFNVYLPVAPDPASLTF
ncbi:ATP-binding protein [Rudanella paleaurantiibacter]|uniref:ATP-binding protein n=1 Tax=Rudanella paleaurantiibacter TaxID=2614655 RepID=UPI001FE5E922|nr:ATP-binding protein [Rudanella paleaurantiibacter]